MAKSRLNRKERRLSRFSCPLALILFLVFFLFIASTAVSLVALFSSARLDSIERRAGAQLAGALDTLSATLARDTAHAASLLATARDMLVSDPSLALDPPALRSRFAPLLRHLPNVVSLSVRVADERSWDITRDGDTWLTRRTVEGDAARNTIWERWNSTGTERLSEHPDAPLAPVEQSKEAQQAIALARGRSDGNRYGTPKAVWSAPARNALTGEPVMLMLAAFERDGQAPIWVGVTADFSETATLARAYGGEDEAQVLIATRDGVLLANSFLDEPESAPGVPQLAPLPLVESISALPMVHALRRWLTDTYPPDGVFSQRTADFSWWFMAQPYRLSTEQDIVLLAGMPEGGLLEVETILRNRLMAGGLSALFAAAVLSWLIARALNRPLREFIRRTQRIDVLDRALGARTHSRIHEIDALHAALDDLSGEVADRVHSREMPLVITAEPVRRIAPAEGALTVSGGDDQLPEAFGDAGGEDLPYVPEAYVQAIQTTRRKLRQLGLEVEAQREARAALEARKEEENRRWAHVRDAAAALATELSTHGHDFDTLATESARSVCHVLDVTRCTVWLVEESFHRLILAHRADRLEPSSHAQLVLDRETHPLFFAALDAAPCLSVRDASTDPRTASYVAAVPWTPPPVSILAAPVRLPHGIVAVLLVEQAVTGGTWPASSESLVCMTAAAMAASWELSRRPDPISTLAETASPMDDDEYAESPLYRQLIEGTRGAVLALNRDGKVTFANTAAEQLYQRPGPEWPGIGLSELAASGFNEIDAQAFRRILSGESRVDTDTEHVTALGTSIPLRLTWAPLEDEEGEVTGAVVLAVDIHDIKDHQGELKRSEARFRGFVEGIAGIFFSIDPMGCINYVSPAAQPIYGYSPGELTGQPIAMLADDVQADRDREAMLSLLQGGTCSGYHATHRARTGELVHLAVFASVRTGSEGEPAGITGVAFPRPPGVKEE